MSETTGVHITDQALRLIRLEHTGDQSSVTGLSEVDFEAPLTAEEVVHGTAHDQLEKAIGKIASSSSWASTSIVICLPGGFFHIQKVPLEVASTEDRREQITWEAAQALTDDLEAYDIDFFSAGRIAFWTAIRKEIREGITEPFSANGIDQIAFTVEPLALFHALVRYNTDPRTRQAIIHWHAPWLDFTAIEHGALIAAETIHICNLHDAPQQILIDQHIRQRVHGELNAEKRRTTFDRIYVCGAPEDMHTLSRPLSGLGVTEMPIFERLDTRLLAPTDAEHLKTPGAFAIAAGAACAQLTE